MITGLAWITAITIGLTAGGAALHFPGSYGSLVFSESEGAFGLILGGVNGLFVGALTWIGLRPPRRNGARLVAMMVVLVGVTHAINDGSSTQLPFVVYSAIAGLAAAGAAALILRERRPVLLAVIGGAWMVGLIVGGWSGEMLGLPRTETPLGWAQDHGWDGLVTGLVWGTATAVVGFPHSIRRRMSAISGGGDGS